MHTHCDLSSSLLTAPNENRVVTASEHFPPLHCYFITKLRPQLCVPRITAESFNLIDTIKNLYAKLIHAKYYLLNLTEGLCLSSVTPERGPSNQEGTVAEVFMGFELFQ